MPPRATRNRLGRRHPERNLRPPASALPHRGRGGVYALIGATGVGKTTSTAKLAAAFAARHGAANLGLITLDATASARRSSCTYGRILGAGAHRRTTAPA